MKAVPTIPHWRCSLRKSRIWSQTMKFEWDKRKAASNAAKHAVRFEDAKPVFEDPKALEFYQVVDGEERWVTIGNNGLQVLVVVYAEPAPGTIRIISAREATKDEKKHYRQR